MLITPMPMQARGASAEVIKAYVETNFHAIRPHQGVRDMCGVQVARVQEGQEIRLGDFIRYYSSMLDAFEVEQIVEIGDDHITLLWIDGDGCEPYTPEMWEKRHEGKRDRWWFAHDNIWGNVPEALREWSEHSTECYSLWRPMDLIEAAKSCRRPHESEYFPFMSSGRGPRSYSKRDVYTQQFNDEDWTRIKSESRMTASVLASNLPGHKPSRWQRVINYIVDKFI